MAESEHPLRRYSDEEVARILERATEMHREDPAHASVGRGMTLEELKAIAGEAGIDHALVQRAAWELDSRVEQASPSSGLLGEARTLVLERVVPGEVDEDTFEILVVEIQRHTGVHGQPSVLGRTLTWRTDTPNNTRSTQVTVISRHGETRIRVEERLHQLVGQLFGGIMGGAGGGLGFGLGLPIAVEVLGSAVLAVALPVGALGLSYAVARGIFVRIARRRRRALQRLLDQLTETVGRSVRKGLEAPDDPRRLPGG